MNLCAGFRRIAVAVCCVTIIAIGYGGNRLGAQTRNSLSAESLFAKAQYYEAREEWFYALATWYDTIAASFSSADEAVYYFETLKAGIESGNDRYWEKLVPEIDRYWTEYVPYTFVVLDTAKSNEISFAQTIDYRVTYSLATTAKYQELLSVVMRGLSARKQTAPRYWAESQRPTYVLQCTLVNAQGQPQFIGEPQVSTGDYIFTQIPLRFIKLLNDGEMSVKVSKMYLRTETDGAERYVEIPLAQNHRLFVAATEERYSLETQLFTRMNAYRAEEILLAQERAGQGYQAVSLDGMMFVTGGRLSGSTQKFVKNFYLSALPLNEEMYAQVMNPSAFIAPSERSRIRGTEAYEKENIEYCIRRCTKERIASAYYRNSSGRYVVDTTSTGYRLLTDEEWEYVQQVYGPVRGQNRYAWIVRTATGITEETAARERSVSYVNSFYIETSDGKRFDEPSSFTVASGDNRITFVAKGNALTVAKLQIQAMNRNRSSSVARIADPENLTFGEARFALSVKDLAPGDYNLELQMNNTRTGFVLPFVIKPLPAATSATPASTGAVPSTAAPQPAGQTPVPASAQSSASAQDKTVPASPAAAPAGTAVTDAAPAVAAKTAASGAATDGVAQSGSPVAAPAAENEGAAVEAAPSEGDLPASGDAEKAAETKKSKPARVGKPMALLTLSYPGFAVGVDASIPVFGPAFAGATVSAGLGENFRLLNMNFNVSALLELGAGMQTGPFLLRGFGVVGLHNAPLPSDGSGTRLTAGLGASVDVLLKNFVIDVRGWLGYQFKKGFAYSVSAGFGKSF